jgi:putative oxidoreductase
MDIKKTLLNPDPIWLPKGMAIIRIVLGGLAIYHGQEVFDSELMSSYMTWDTFKNPYGKFMVYLGKSSELLAGTLLLLGLFTRLGALMLMGTLAYVTFFVGHGKFWYEDQHPFMFVLMGLVFFVHGPGEWSLDAWFAKRNNS